MNHVVSFAEIENRLLSQAVALVERAMGGRNEPRIVESLLAACHFLEESSHTAAPIVAIEQEIHLETGLYLLSVRRLSSSVPAGKFQIIITRSLSFGLIY